MFIMVGISKLRIAFMLIMIGNGIQQAFESEPNVLYISLHVHENGNFYPSGPYGDMYHCGEGAGIGKLVTFYYHYHYGPLIA